MFENIIAQDNVVNGLKRELASNELPSSMLFYGEQFSGKLTTALELARVLTCEKENAEWNCSCKSCGMNRLLIHPNVVLLGSRSFYQEIAACADVLKRTKKRFAQYLLIRAVRKLTRRFDDFLWEGNEGKMRKVVGAVREVEDETDFFLPSEASSADERMQNDAELEKKFDNILGLSSRIVSDTNLQVIPIDLVRKVNYWAHTTSAGARKVVIIENAHKMLESARNALLKVLEEPPAGVYFILIAPRKSTLISTILSRVRHYYFKQRSETEAREVLTKIFREENEEFTSIKDYFLAWTDMNREVIDGAVAKFFDNLFDTENTTHLSLEQDGVFARLDDRDYTVLFLEELLHRMSGKMREYSGGEDGPALVSIFEKMKRTVHETYIMIDVYNQRPILALQSMFLQMREIL